MTTRNKKLYALLASACLTSQVLLPAYCVTQPQQGRPAADQPAADKKPEKPYTKTFQIYGKEGGAYSITALVVPTGKPKPVPLEKRIERKPPPDDKKAGADEGKAPADTKKADDDTKDKTDEAKKPVETFTKEQVDQMVKDATKQLAEQQKQLVDQLKQDQANQTAQTKAAINELAQSQAQQLNAMQQQFNAMNAQQRAEALATNEQMRQIAAQQQQQFAANQAAINRLVQQQQNFMNRGWANRQRDRMMREFERELMADRMFGDGWGRWDRRGGRMDGRDVLNMVRDMFNTMAMSNLAQQGGQRAPSADEIANRVTQSLSDRLPEDVASKVNQALGKAMQQAAAVEELNRFAQLNDNLAQIVTKLNAAQPSAAYKADPFAFPQDDYERLALMAAQMPDPQLKKQFLEMAIDTAGRIAINSSANPAQVQRARDFAMRTAQRFHELKAARRGDRTFSDAIEYDIDKCMMISSSKGLYI